MLRAGDEALVPVGTPHRWWNAGPGDAVVSVEMRPGLHFEELLEEAFQLVDEGKFGETGPSTRQPPTAGPRVARGVPPRLMRKASPCRSDSAGVGWHHLRCIHARG